MEQLYAFINYFHKDNTVNRTTLGLDNVKGGRTLVHWRVTDLIYLAVLLVLYPIAYHIEPFQRQFYIGDLLISHPFAEHERVTNLQLFFYAGWVPISVIALVSVIITKPLNKVYVAYISLLGLLLSVLSTSVLTDTLKNSFGRHRPDFLARCIPRPDAPTDVMVYAKDVCTTKNLKRLLDGFRTTPLGHSSISFAGLLYLSLWLSGQLTVTRPQAGAWRFVVSFLPTLGAILIALSRTEDYRHHFIDVFVGLVIGSIVATWLYFRLFPCVTETHCYEPRLLLVEEEDLGYLPVEV